MAGERTITLWDRLRDCLNTVQRLSIPEHKAFSLNALGDDFSELERKLSSNQSIGLCNSDVVIPPKEYYRSIIRGYYRCTHRHTRNCVATKQVQKSDEDSSIYKITYRGEHTCVQGTQLVQAQYDPIMPAQMKSSPKQPPSPQEQEIYIAIGPGGDLKVEPELQPENQAQLSRSLSFTSAYLQPDPIENFMLSYCTPLGSPTTSNSSYLPESPYMTPMANTGLSVLTSKTDINEAVSGPNSVTNSSGMGDGDFKFCFEEYINLEGDFSFDN